MYQKFEIRPPLLVQATPYFGTRVDEGSAKMWGGDIDAELDFPVSYWARLYLLGGVGWYDQQNSYRQLTFGASQMSSLVGRVSTGMRFEKNAGVGAEFAIGDRASFFVDARYMRFGPSGAKSDFVPIRFGVRY
jgi:opacity protein-like surface antigen